MKTYDFVIVFADGRRQKRQVSVDPKQWTFDQIVDDLKTMPGVVSISLVILTPPVETGKH